MTNDTDNVAKKLLPMVLREIASVMENADNDGDYIGEDEEFVADPAKTIREVGWRLRKRAETMERGEG